MELALEKRNLGLVGVETVFVGEAHKREYKEIGLKQTKSEDDEGTSRQKRAAFPCRLVTLKATVLAVKFMAPLIFRLAAVVTMDAVGRL